MTLQPNFLPVGSVVEVEANGQWNPTVIEFKDIKHLIEFPIRFNKSFRPIKLTPEILTEWCGLIKNSDNSPYDYSNKDCSFCICENSGYFKIATAIENVGKQFNMLHQLQLAYLVHTQTVLPITIK